MFLQLIIIRIYWCPKSKLVLIILVRVGLGGLIFTIRMKWNGRRLKGMAVRLA